MKFAAPALALLLAGTAIAQAPEAAPPVFQAGPAESLELREARWFDGRKFRAGTLFVHEGRFVAEAPAGVVLRRLDLAGRFLVPPLAEAHNHNLQNAWGFGRFAPRYIADGVFYAAMLCGDPPTVAPLRERAGRPDMPDVEFVTTCITSSDGHPLGMLLNDDAPGAPKLRFEDVADKAVLVMDSEADVARKWPLVAARPGRLIKLIMSYHERPALRREPKNQGRLGVSAEVAAAIVRHAHKNGLRVSAHVDSAADFAAALRAGVDQIAHLPGYFFHHGSREADYLIAPELAREAAQRGIQVVTTTAASGLFGADAALLARIEATQQRNLRTLREAGVPLLLGSDVFFGTALTEYRRLQQLAVFEPAELLRLATVSTPRALFPERRLGCFEPGCEASFLALPADPLREPAALEKPTLRVKQGRLLTPAPAPAAP
ncbi:amidohydrolase family protein [Roseateles sp. DAIF2]|uniref:amidohydrolase family protein n=1 Tax=Roseateles sp. DAIF2 TaxID=2714952 RepID=UPI0018A3157D|nr:amidohydrolase family protein [Roseateles sp. DAIF2]QPF74412.1 amidohydrolase family protein [Roseateles sp. DAIF2]